MLSCGVHVAQSVTPHGTTHLCDGLPPILLSRSLHLMTKTFKVEETVEEATEEMADKFDEDEAGMPLRGWVWEGWGMVSC